MTTCTDTLPHWGRWPQEANCEAIYTPCWVSGTEWASLGAPPPPPFLLCPPPVFLKMLIFFWGWRCTPLPSLSSQLTILLPPPHHWGSTIIRLVFDFGFFLGWFCSFLFSLPKMRLKYYKIFKKIICFNYSLILIFSSNFINQFHNSYLPFTIQLIHTCFSFISSTHMNVSCDCL